MKYLAPLFVLVAIFATAFVYSAQAGSVGGEYTYKHYSSANASSTIRTIVKGGYGELGTVTINTTPGAVVRLYDAATTTAATSTLSAIAVIKATTSEMTLTYEVSLSQGLTIEMPGAFTGDLTIAVR